MERAFHPDTERVWERAFHPVDSVTQRAQARVTREVASFAGKKVTRRRNAP